ncbi:MAG: tRNA (guanosine(37)-N1)-methyltransferase TrmD [Erysipelotrichales bacterium]|nr:tRNA (guanosine(37)-N1)-methyltransferase TrmD [Erysipelotrichales bacterium]
MKITVLTLFPEMFEGFLNTSIIKRAIDKESVEIELVNFRDFTLDKHNHVDDTPCGGGQGMVIACQSVVDALESVKTENSYTIVMSPRGRTYNQKVAHEFSKHEHIIILCGHYEGFDERIMKYVDEEISIGDFILTGGELGAMVVSDSIIRLINGVIRNESHEDESFENGLLEYPQYTRPIDFRGDIVPEVLLSGHHENIRKWRLEKSLELTLERRPDLLENRSFSEEERKILEKLKK